MKMIPSLFATVCGTDADALREISWDSRDHGLLGEGFGQLLHVSHLLLIPAERNAQTAQSMSLTVVTLTVVGVVTLHGL